MAEISGTTTNQSSSPPRRLAFAAAAGTFALWIAWIAFASEPDASETARHASSQARSALQPVDDAGHEVAVAIDNVGGWDPAAPASLVRYGRDVGVAGWAIDLTAGKPAVAVVALLDDRPVSRSVPRQPRPDVAAANNDRNLTNSGYDLRIPAKALRRGIHELELRVSGHGDSVVEAEPAKRTLVVV